MTAGVAHHLARRAVDITQQHINSNDGGQTSYEIGKWAFLVIFATFVTYLAMISMVSRRQHCPKPAIDKANILILDLLHLWQSRSHPHHDRDSHRYSFQNRIYRLR